MDENKNGMDSNSEINENNNMSERMNLVSDEFFRSVGEDEKRFAEKMSENLLDQTPDPDKDTSTDTASPNTSTLSDPTLAKETVSSQNASEVRSETAPESSSATNHKVEGKGTEEAKKVLSEEAKEEVKKDAIKADKVIKKAKEKKEKKEAPVFLQTMLGVCCGAMIMMPVMSHFVRYDLQSAVNETKPPITNVQQTIPYYGPTNVSVGSNSVADIVAEVMPSVISVEAVGKVEQFSFFGGSNTVEVPMSGSGFIVSQKDGSIFIATNNHVIQDADEIKVKFFDDTTAVATVNGTSPTKDIAVLQVKLSDIEEGTRNKIKIAKVKTTSDSRVGDQVIAIGNAIGYGQSVTVGYVSALEREVQSTNNTKFKVIQTDAAINPGNSGGALIDLSGSVIGINVAKIASTDVEGIGYAIPVADVFELIGKLSEEPVIEEERGVLGIQGMTVNEDMKAAFGMPSGVFVKSVYNDAVEKDGLREMDIITGINGETIETMDALKETIGLARAGDEVTLNVLRIENGEYKEFTIKTKLVKKGSLKEPELPEGMMGNPQPHIIPGNPFFGN